MGTVARLGGYETFSANDFFAVLPPKVRAIPASRNPVTSWGTLQTQRGSALCEPASLDA